MIAAVGLAIPALDSDGPSGIKGSGTSVSESRLVGVGTPPDTLISGGFSLGWGRADDQLLGDPGLTFKRLRVYIALSAFQGGDNSCYPSIDQISERAHVSSRDVRYALNWLNEKWITIDRSSGQRNQYHVHLSPLYEIPLRESSPPARNEQGSNRAGVGGSNRAGDPCVNHASIKEQEKNIEKNNGRFSESEFLAFYDAYPKHANKKATLAKYKTVRKSGTTQEQLLAGAKRFAAYHQAEKTPVNFICAPDVWLNKGKWEDEYGSNWESEGDVN